MKPADYSVRRIVEGVRQGDFTATDVVAACLRRVDELDPTLHAFLHVDRVGAMAAAERIDADRRAGRPLGALAGLPIAVKDALCTADQPTTCGSRFLQGYVPPYDAEAVRRLREAGAVIIGKTSLDEFAMGGSNENCAYGPVRNPWDPSRAPGGSSGGSAACVAAGMAPAAIGSDTGGSIRQPAGLCGITGLKPTYGRVSRRGLVAFASSLDQIGPMARSADDCSLLLETLAGHDPGDSTSLDEPVPAYGSLLEGSLEGLRIGRVPAHFGAGLDPEVRRAVEEAFAVYRAAGASIVDIDLPHAAYGVATYYIVAPCEASSNLARYDGMHFGTRAAPAAKPTADVAGDPADSPLVDLYCASRGSGFGPEVKRRIMLGTYALSAGYYDAYYAKALRVRRLIRQDYLDAFERVDLIGGPVSATAAFRLGEKTADPLAMYLVDLYTVGTNLAGVAGISFPCGFTGEGLPVGFHLQGPALSEPLLLRAADRFQRLTEWHARRPPEPGSRMLATDIGGTGSQGRREAAR